jgi:hypothetical protein
VQTDAASQPKIVDGGTLVTGGLAFDGTDFFNTSLVPPSAATLIGVATWGVGGGMIVGARDSTNKRSYISRTSSTSALILGLGSSNLSSGSITLGDESLAFGAYSGTTADVSLNGVNTTFTGITAPVNTTYGYRIGALNSSGTNVATMNGRIREVIVYASDQTDNRTALEANIGEVYGIAGIPAYDNTVNGFVETWYDQSGNGNNATQLTASDQPRIVLSGNLVTSSNGLPAIRVNAQAQSFDLDSNIGLGNFSSFYVVKHTTFGSAVSWLSDNNGADYFRYTPISYNVDAGGVDNGFIGLDATLATATDYLISAIRGSGTIEFSVSGSVQSNTDSNSGTLDVKKIFQRGNNETQGLNGYAQELIIYPTDETANRPAIEANINNQYDIY